MPNDPVLTGYLSEEELAKEFALSPRTIQRWRLEGQGPPVTVIGVVPYYAVESVRQWLRSRERKMPRERQQRTA